MVLQPENISMSKAKPQKSIRSHLDALGILFYHQQVLVVWFDLDISSVSLISSHNPVFIITLVVKLHLESSLDRRDLVSTFNRKYLELRSESLL